MTNPKDLDYEAKENMKMCLKMKDTHSQTMLQLESNSTDMELTMMKLEA